MRRKAQSSNSVFHSLLVLEMRDTGLAVSRPHRRVDEMLHACLARERRDALALLFLTCDTRLPGVLHGEHTPVPLQRVLQRGRVIQVAAHELGAGRRRDRFRSVAVGMTRHRLQRESFTCQRSRGRPALFPGRARNQYRFFIRHFELLDSRSLDSKTPRLLPPQFSFLINFIASATIDPTSATLAGSTIVLLSFASSPNWPMYCSATRSCTAS